MNDAELRSLFKIPDPVTAAEFARRTGKTESSVRHMVDRRQLPMVTEREVIGSCIQCVDCNVQYLLFCAGIRWLKLM